MRYASIAAVLQLTAEVKRPTSAAVFARPVVPYLLLLIAQQQPAE